MKQLIIGFGMMSVIILTLGIFMMMSTDTVSEIELEIAVDSVVQSALEDYMNDEYTTAAGESDIEAYLVEMLADAYDTSSARIQVIENVSEIAEDANIAYDLAVRFIATDAEMGIISIEVFTLYTNFAENKTKGTQYTVIYERPL